MRAWARGDEYLCLRRVCRLRRRRGSAGRSGSARARPSTSPTSGSRRSCSRRPKAPVGYPHPFQTAQLRVGTVPRPPHRRPRSLLLLRARAPQDEERGCQHDDYGHDPSCTGRAHSHPLSMFSIIFESRCGDTMRTPPVSSAGSSFEVPSPEQRNSALVPCPERSLPRAGMVPNTFVRVHIGN